MTFRLTPYGAFELREAKRFIEGFDPSGQPTTDDEDLHLALLSDEWDPAFVSLHQTDQRVVGTVGDGSDAARDQVERMLSLDLDGTPFDRLDDGVISALRDRHRGLRPVLFSTPYEAACWSVLTQRTSMAQAARLRCALCQRAGRRFRCDDHEWWTFPSPGTLARIRSVAGATSTQIDRLRSVARAALDGRLDPGRLRRMTSDEAIEQLKAIDGIGRFGSELIYVRGAGAPDHFPRNEPRLRAHMTQLYGLDDPSLEQLADIAERWAPFRSWASLLIRLDAQPTNHQGAPT